MKKEKFTSEHYDPRILLAIACRHFRAAYSLRNDPFALFSAGYLCHLSIELTLKACLLHEKGKFPNSHNLIEIHKKSGGIKWLSLNKNEMELLKDLDKLFVLRYPLSPENIQSNLDIAASDIDANQYGEVGTITIDDTLHLLRSIKSKMPPELSSHYESDEIKCVISL